MTAGGQASAAAGLGWLACAAMLALPCAGQAATVAEQLEHCVRNAAEVQQIECLDGLRAHADGRLEASYAATRQHLASLDPGFKDQLSAAQQSWAAMRDADCATLKDSSGPAGVSLKPDVAYARCMAEHSLNRANYVDASLRRPIASLAESSRIRTLRNEALNHRAALAAAALSASPQVHECRYESAISTPPPGHTVALTFDDGPEEGETEFILDTLQRHRIRAAFFLIGEKAHQHPELVAKLVAAGHLVLGNHSWSHPNFHDISTELQQSEVSEGGEQLKDDLHPRLFRYPYGNSSCATNDFLHQQGYRIVGWHVDSCDWAFDQTGSVNGTDARICEVSPDHLHDYVGHVVSQVQQRGGGIVLMHEIHPHTLHRLEEVISRLEALGFSFGSIDEPSFASSLR